MCRCRAFTLAELLIALVILGVIATFTIPKVLQAQADQQARAVVLEGAGMISNAFTAYQQQNSIVSTTKPSDLTPYMNYVRVVTTGSVDGIPTLVTSSCASVLCLQLHNGSILWTNDYTFNGTSTMSAIYFQVDPDGKVTGLPGDEGLSVGLWLYTNGRMTSRGYILAGTIDGNVACPCSPSPSWDPSWFHWN